MHKMKIEATVTITEETDFTKWSDAERKAFRADQKEDFQFAKENLEKDIANMGYGSDITKVKVIEFKITETPE